MKLTKDWIVNRINKLVINYKVTWNDIVDDLDSAIEEINDYMSTVYPPVSEVLNDFCSPEKTYSYRAGGEDKDFFPKKYFRSIVLPFVAKEVLSRDEEFTTIFTKYTAQYQESLFVMTRDEINMVPQHLVSAPKGVYFANPEPEFKRNPEQYFNRKIYADVPRTKVFYSWGKFSELVPYGVSVFVDKPLPIDNNSYEMGTTIMPVVMSGENFGAFIVDYEKKVLGIFLGWSFNNDNRAEGIITEPIKLHEDAQLYGVFDLDIIGITYKGNGGTIQNWVPSYISREDFLNKPILPFGGTAYKKGFKFLGLVKEQYVLREENEIKDVEEELRLEFSADWERSTYEISYRNFKGNFKTIFNSYSSGNEFELEEPKSSDLETQTFLGWFDNEELTGRRVYKITEEDVGDKTFYAKYDEQKFLIRFFDNQEKLKEKVFINGAKIFSGINLGEKIILKEDGFDKKVFFVKFETKEGLTFEEGKTKAEQNTDFYAIYSEELAIEKQIKFKFKVKNTEFNRIDEIERTLLKEVGSYLDIKEDVVRPIADGGGISYINDSVEYFIEGFILNGNITKGLTDSFRITLHNDYNLISKYTTNKNTVQLFGKTLISGVQVTNESYTEVNLPIGIDARNALLFLYYKNHLSYNLGETLFLTALKQIVATGGGATQEQEIVDVVEGGTKITPRYSLTEDETILKVKLEILDFPQKGTSITTTKKIYARIGEQINLSLIKNEVFNDQEYIHLIIEDFYNNKYEEVYTNKISNTVITMDSNRIIFCKSKERIKMSVSILNDINGGVIELLEVKASELQEDLTIDLSNFTTMVPTWKGQLIFKGWTRLVGSSYTGNIKESLKILRTETSDITLVPFYEKEYRSKVYFSFYDYSQQNDEPQTFFDGGSYLTSPTRTEMEIRWSQINDTNKIIFQSYEQMISSLNEFSDESDLLLESMQSGYKFHSYNINGLGIEYFFPIQIDGVFLKNKLETADYDLHVEVRLERVQGSTLLEISNFHMYEEAEKYRFLFSKPNIQTGVLLKERFSDLMNRLDLIFSGARSTKNPLKRYLEEIYKEGQGEAYKEMELFCGQTREMPSIQLTMLSTWQGILYSTVKENFAFETSRDYEIFPRKELV